LVEKYIKKELLAIGAASMTRTMPQLPPDTVNLVTGDPDFNQPEFINKAVYEAMKEGHTHYAFGGDPEFKEAIANYYQKFGVEVDPKTQVQITSGGSQAIYRAFGTILNPDDEIVIMNPSYTGYDQPAAYFGGKMVRSKQMKDKKGIFRPDFTEIENAINDNTKAVLICNPDNPTGTVWTVKELEKLAEIANDKDILVITDEIYTEYVWGYNKHNTMLGLPGMLERNIVLMSFSKTFAWTGCRAGFMISGPELMNHISNVPIGISGMPLPFQKAATKALKDGWGFVDEMRKEYKKRIDFMVPRLNEIEGVNCPYPEGTFYLFPEVKGLKVAGIRLIMDMMMKQKLLIATGVMYGSNGVGHLRFALVRPVEELEKAANRLEAYLKDQ
jgi:aspartate/methionine/tyrosine aminotransferase